MSNPPSYLIFVCHDTAQYPHQLQNGVQGSPAMMNLGPQNVIGVQLANMPKPPI